MHACFNPATGNYLQPSANGLTIENIENVLDDIKIATDRLIKAGQELNLQTPRPGTPEFIKHRNMLVKKCAGLGSNEPWYSPRTPEKLKKVLDRYCKLPHSDIRIFYGNPVTGLDSLEDQNTIGGVYRSEGPATNGLKKIMFAPKDSTIGYELDTTTIVKVVDLRQNLEIYSHPKYHVPQLVISSRKIPGNRNQVITSHMVLAKTTKKFEPFARFPSRALCQKWIDFVSGKVHEF